MSENGEHRSLPFYAMRAVYRAMPAPLKAPLLGTYNSVSRGLSRFRKRAVASVGKHRCSICESRVLRFEPLPPIYMEEFQRYGFKYTPADAEMCNAEGYTCPWCGATDRDRLYALYLRDYFRTLSPEGPVKIVEFAPTPQLSNLIRKLIAGSEHSFSYRTADLYMEGVDDKVDLMDMKAYADDSVDFFICSHMLEHVDDDRRALGELYRILKHGGQGILVVPIELPADEIDEDPSVTDPGERWRRFGQFDHVRLYSKEGFVSRVRQAGFLVRQLGAEHFGKAVFEKYGITDQSVLYIVGKS